MAQNTVGNHSVEAGLDQAAFLCLDLSEQLPHKEPPCCLGLDHPINFLFAEVLDSLWGAMQPVSGPSLRTP